MIILFNKENVTGDPIDGVIDHVRSVVSTRVRSEQHYRPNDIVTVRYGIDRRVNDRNFMHENDII